MYEKELDALGQEIVTGKSFDPERFTTREAVLGALLRIGLGGQLERKELSILQDLEVTAPPVNSFTATAPPTKKTTVWLMPNLETCHDPATAENAVARIFAETILSEKNTPTGKMETETNRLLLQWGFRPTHTEQPARAGAAA
jgi:hypothetical protein